MIGRSPREHHQVGGRGVWRIAFANGRAHQASAPSFSPPLLAMSDPSHLRAAHSQRHGRLERLNCSTALHTSRHRLHPNPACPLLLPLVSAPTLNVAAAREGERESERARASVLRAIERDTHMAGHRDSAADTHTPTGESQEKEGGRKAFWVGGW